MTSTVTPSRLRFIATTHKLQILAVIFLLASMALHSYSTYSRGVLPDFLTTELLKSISNAAMVALMLVTLALSWNVFGILGFILFEMQGQIRLQPGNQIAESIAMIIQGIGF